MADAESIRQVAQSRAPFSTWLGVVLLFALFGVIVLAVIGPAPRSDDYEQKRAKAREEKLKTAREEDAKALTSYAWIDKNKGVARIPVARAMELTLVELAQKKPEPAGPIATPEPAAPGAATGAPAPPAAPSASPTPAPSGSPAPAQSPPGSPTPVPAKTP
jgi:hypothetical protein